MCDQTGKHHPESPESLVRAAVIAMKQDRPAEAEGFVRQAVALNPNSDVIWNNLGLALRNQNRIAEALECFEIAIRLAPNNARAHYDRAFALLLKGSYIEGFSEYEHRWKANGLELPGEADPELRERLWRGQEVADRTVLLYSEQGLGDTVQFVRYAALLRARGARVVLEVQPELRDLMGWLQPECTVGNGDGSAAFDYHCPLMTLPVGFGTTVETIPPPAGLSVSPQRRASWETKIRPAKPFKVGLVWAGSMQNPMDDRRSTSVSTFDSLLGDKELRTKTRFFSFQVGPHSADIDVHPYRLACENLSPHLTAATETAAALTQMDLVISVDTFVAHLAATLGITVWVMLAFAPDWRWLLGRDDSPWYPSVRLFRQSAPGDWEGVALRIRQALYQRLN